MNVPRLALAAATLALVGCTSDDGDTTPATPAPAGATTSSVAAPTTSPSAATTTTATTSTTVFVPDENDRLVVRSGAASHVLVALPFADDRGVPWAMDQRSADGTWTQRYVLNASANPDVPEQVFRLGEDVVEWPDLGVTGPGPDRVPLPAGVEAGAWRVCPINLRTFLGCVSFELDPGRPGSDAVAPGPYAGAGRSHLAAWDVRPDGVLVSLDLGDDAPPEEARLQLDDPADGWVTDATLDVDERGVTFVPGLSPELRRLCFPGLGPEVACVIVPPSEA